MEIIKINTKKENGVYPLPSNLIQHEAINIQSISTSDLCHPKLINVIICYIGEKYSSLEFYINYIDKYKVQFLIGGQQHCVWVAYSEFIYDGVDTLYKFSNSFFAYDFHKKNKKIFDRHEKIEKIKNNLANGAN